MPLFQVKLRHMGIIIIEVSACFRIAKSFTQRDDLDVKTAFDKMFLPREWNILSRLTGAVPLPPNRVRYCIIRI
jgi:hypothetical protein